MISEFLRAVRIHQAGRIVWRAFSIQIGVDVPFYFRWELWHGTN